MAASEKYPSNQPDQPAAINGDKFGEAIDSMIENEVVMDNAHESETAKYLTGDVGVTYMIPSSCKSTYPRWP